MNYPFTQSYFIEVIEGYFSKATYLNQQHIEKLIAENHEALILNIPYLKDIPYLLHEWFPFSDFHLELINKYELYSSLRGSINQIIEICLPIIESNRPIEEEQIQEEVSDMEIPSPFEDIKPMFIDEASFKAFEMEYINQLNDENTKKEDVVDIAYNLMLKYQNKGLLKEEDGEDFTDNIKEFILWIKELKKGKIDKEEVKNRILEKINPVFLFFEKEYSIDVFNNLKMDSVELIIKNMSEFKDKKDKYIYSKYDKLIQRAILDTKIKYDSLIERELEIEVKYERPLIKEIDISSMFIDAISDCKSSLYEINYKRNLKRECFKFFVHYESLKTLKWVKFQNKNIQEIFEEITSYYEELLKPSEPLVKFSNLKGKIETKSNIKSENSDIRNKITGKLTQEQILAYFNQLCDFPSKTGEKKQMLTEKEVYDLVASNFAGFSEKIERRKFHTPHINQKQLRKFVHVFYERNTTETKTIPYIYFLKDNFSIFDNTSLETLSKSFNR